MFVYVTLGTSCMATHFHMHCSDVTLFSSKLACAQKTTFAYTTQPYVSVAIRMEIIALAHHLIMSADELSHGTLKTLCVYSKEEPMLYHSSPFESCTVISKC